MTRHFTQGHPTGLLEGFAKTLLMLHLADSPVLSVLDLRNSVIERIRGAFQLLGRKGVDK